MKTVIPAKAGIQFQSRVCGDMSLVRVTAQEIWTPAFAGVARK